MMVILATSVYAVNYDITVSNKNVIDVSQIDTTNRISSWSCDLGTAPASFELGSCYCLDTNPTTSTDGSTDRLGYGDLNNCLSQGTIARVKADTTGSFLLRLSTQEVTVTEDPGEVTIRKLGDSSVECVHDDTSLTEVYAFFVERPFSILNRTMSSVIDIPTMVGTGDQIRCQVALYDGWRFNSQRVSENSVSVSNPRISFNNVYTAPAHPTAGDELFCYGSGRYDLDPSKYEVDHTFRWYRNGVLSQTTIFTDSDGQSSIYLENFVGFQKGDDIYCDYTLELRNMTSGMIETTENGVSDTTVIRNKRPVMPVVSIGVIP